ncbi:MAG: ferredoxin [Chloroflexi bacterium]|nr:ferredoxin [Chloroflexota bacterium]
MAIDTEQCIDCYACRSACPFSAIRVWDGLAHVCNPAACLSCVATPCVPSCPTGAIHSP